MLPNLEFYKELDFYGIPTYPYKSYTKYRKNLKIISEIYLKKKFFKEKGNPLKGYYKNIYEEHNLYKKKYNIIQFIDDITKNYIFDRKYKFPVHKLILYCNYLKNIKFLPKELKILTIKNSVLTFNINPNLIPKSIVSMIFILTNFPLDGADLSGLKKLKCIDANNSVITKMPKFPKSIEYLSFQNCNIKNFSSFIKEFKLSDYPNLQYFNISGSNLSNKIPEEWKKENKINILY